MNKVEETIKVYEDISEDYFKEHFDIKEIKEQIDYFIKNLKGKKVLDIGCGPGRDAKYFSENGLDVIGVDLTSNFIKIASKNVPNAEFLKMDMRNLNFKENSFDGIWVCASFLHISKEEAKEVLLEFRKVLKEKSLLFVSVKKGEEERFVEKEKYKGKKKFFSFYSEKEFKDLVEKCGFKIIKFNVENNKSIWLNAFAIK